MITSVLYSVGSATLGLCESIGKLSFFIATILRRLVSPPFYWNMIGKQMLDIGFFSLPVIGFTALFTGAVLALQSYTGFARMHAEGAIASIVVISMTRELGPVLAGLMIAGRLGASIAAEIGTMKVTEQIDALYTLNTDPFSYLILPRVLGGTVMLPCLVLIADVIGVLGGYLIAVGKLGFNPYLYITKMVDFLQMEDIISGLIKAAVFGFIVCTIGCYYGYNTRGGSEGVGKSVIYTVVNSSILILFSNYLITALLFTR